MANIWEQVADLNMSHMSDTDLLKVAKAAQAAVNRRIRSLESAGLASKATTGGLKFTSVRSIKTRAQAKRAVNRARAMNENPLSTPGSVRKLVRSAEKELGVKSSQVVVGVDAAGKPMTTTRGVPFKRPLKQTTLSEAENIRRFWHWIEEGAGQNKFYVSDANVILHEALAKGVNAVSLARRKLEEKEREKEQEEKVIMEKLYPNSGDV